ncbi:galactokinase family protein [Marinilabilia salmonicolor]|jgi:galactokinase|uniref:Galactokinase n=1 Tax=Marinilabilia salmonicolor TaxID=989 RepID=A0A368UUT6_9BACT|nr:galactokinase family protein [Marinilabilia salmonicolor]RCW31124.1 galactokinase [Marinilabilia salmonicolor]
MAKIESLIQQINNGNNEAFKRLYGTDAGELKSQAERYAELMEEFKSIFDQDDVELFSSPGRTEIGGNHTDHNHGRVLAGAVNLDNIAVAAANGTDIIRIKSAGYPEFQVDLSNLGPNEQEHYTSTALVRGIVAKMKANGYNAGGFDACIEGRVPKGSGLSSSASFEVLIGAIVNHLFNDGKMDAVENAIIGQWAENNFFGKPCGLMDQTACSVGGLITIDFKDPSDPVVKPIGFDFVSSGYSLVITDVGGGHDDPASQQEYASLPTEMKSVARELGAEVLREVTLEQIVDKIPEIREKTGDRAILRAIHFQGDNKRVADQVKALEENDFQSFLKMVVESGQSSYMYNQNIYDITHKEEQVVSLGLALSEMVLKGKGAWRVHGGGFGGTIQAFVPQEKLQEYVKTLEHVYGKGKCHTMFIRPEGSIKVVL